MSVGKYSPTVSASYAHDQEWFNKNCDPDGDANLDKDGFDRYGYSGLYGNGPDRAGYTEDEYMQGAWDDDFEVYSYDLYDNVSHIWGGIVIGRDKLPI